MGDVFKKDFLQAECDMIDQHQVLVNLPHVAHMRHDFQPELSCQQTHGQEFTDAANARAVNLEMESAPAPSFRGNLRSETVILVIICPVVYATIGSIVNTFENTTIQIPHLR